MVHLQYYIIKGDNHCIRLCNIYIWQGHYLRVQSREKKTIKNTDTYTNIVCYHPYTILITINGSYPPIKNY